MDGMLRVGKGCKGHTAEHFYTKRHPRKEATYPNKDTRVH